MPRRSKSDIEASPVDNSAQLSVRVKPEQDLLLSLVARMRGVDKSSLVMDALDKYIAEWPPEIAAALKSAQEAVSKVG